MNGFVHLINIHRTTYVKHVDGSKTTFEEKYSSTKTYHEAFLYANAACRRCRELVDHNFEEIQEIVQNAHVRHTKVGDYCIEYEINGLYVLIRYEIVYDIYLNEEEK